MNKKRILLVTVAISGYEQELIKEMEKKGFLVDYFPQGSKIKGKYLGFLGRIYRTLYKDFKIKYFKPLLAKKQKIIYQKYMNNLSDSYDYVFDFGAKSRDVFIKLLKKRYDAKFILYLWDDLKYSNNAWEIMDLFDERYIFNSDEALKYNFKYRSNFYTDRFRYDNEEKNIDIFYKGSLRDPDRTLTLSKIDKYTQGLNKQLSLFAKKGYMHNIKKVDSKVSFNKYCSNEYMSMDELAYNYKKSKVLIDIAYKDQSGLGLRPIEAIASNCKLITTNENIKNYEFYNENNIFILKNNYEEIMEFMKKPYIEPSPEIKHKYSISGFVEEIFNI